MKLLGKILGVSALLALFTSEAMAQSTGIAGMTSNWWTQVKSVTDVISTISYVSGIGFMFKAILKFKEHNESKGQVPLSNAIVLFVVAGCLLGLPYMVSVAKSSAVGSGASSTGIGTSALQSVQ